MKNTVEVYSANIYRINHTRVINHAHDQEYQIFYVAEGTANYVCNGKEMLLNAGQALFVEPGIVHERSDCSHDCKLLDAKFGINDIALQEKLRGCKELFINMPQDVRQLFELTVEVIDKKEEYWHKIASLTFELIFYTLLKISEEKVPAKDTEAMDALHIDYEHLTPCVSRSLQFIEGFIVLPAEPFSVSALARQVGYDKHYLSKKFKDDMGISITQYYSMIRLKKAKEFLRKTDLSIMTISRILGYSKASHFMKNFRANEGISPSKYKKIQIDLDENEDN